MIDARRMEVYSSLYNLHLELLREIKAEIIIPDSFKSDLESFNIHFFGDGAMKCAEMIKNENATFINGFLPSSAYMGKTSYKLFNEGQFENLAYFEPFYLKDFVATVPINKML